MFLQSPVRISIFNQHYTPCKRQTSMTNQHFLISSSPSGISKPVNQQISIYPPAAAHGLRYVV